MRPAGGYIENSHLCWSEHVNYYNLHVDVYYNCPRNVHVCHVSKVMLRGRNCGDKVKPHPRKHLGCVRTIVICNISEPTCINNHWEF